MEKTKSPIDDPLSFKVIGCCMKVQGILGGGLLESTYQKALVVEFNKQKVKFIREMAFDLFYEKVKVGGKRVDFFIENKLVLEIKAVPIINSYHFAQAVSYCQALNTPFGLLINFGGRNLEYRRVYNAMYKK